MERLPDHSDFDDQTAPHVDLSKQTITKIAQNLYDIYKSSGINISEWIKCLTEYLSEHFMNMSPEDVLGYIIEKIIRGDKGIQLEQIHFDGQQDLIREVAEWLSAEHICEGMVTYEHDIEQGIKDGRYQEIHSIEDVTVIKDHEVFHGRKSGRATKGQKEEIKKNIIEHYVIKRSEMLGHGTRVNVFELVPRRIPMPIPRRDELIEGLMLQSPNKFLVIRVLRDSYRKELGSTVDASEEEAIETFVLAKKYLVFIQKDLDIDMIQETTGMQAEEVLIDKAAELKAGINSFIPPLIIVKAKLTEQSDAEYITIQKRVKARGVVSRGDSNFKKDICEFPGFRDKVKQFLSACKKFYKKTNRVPDTVGRGNVLYTRKGNIYLVDINNIAPEPDYKILSLIMLFKEIESALNSPYFKENTDELRSEYFNVLKEIFDVFGGSEKYKHFDLKMLQTIVANIYSEQNNPLVYEFFKKTNLIDDKDEPIFMHNIDNLMRIETEILDAEREDGLINDEEYKEKYFALCEECLYKIVSPLRGAWKYQRSYNVLEIIKNKNQGHDNWMAYYMPNLYSSIRNKYCAG